MSVRLEGNSRAEWRQHWPTVIAAMAGVAMSTINSYSVGVFIEPLQQAFGWSRAAISLGPALTAPVVIVLAPFLGLAIDRIGPRRIGIIGVTALFLCNVLLGAVGPSIWSWWAVWGLIAVGNLFIQPSVWTAAISGMFSAGRGLALAIALCGSGIGSMITPYLSYTLISHFGWRLGFVGLSSFWGFIAIPLVYFLFTSIKDIARKIPGRAAAAVLTAAPAAATGRRQLLSWKFMRLAAAGGIIASVVLSLVMNLVPVLTWNGLTRAEAAGLAPLLGITSIAGRLLIGFLLDRVPGTLLAGASVCLPIAASLLLLTQPASVPAAAVAILILGFTLGAELDLVSYLTSRYFGLQNFGLLFGTIGGLITLLTSLAPLAMNSVYDATGSYAHPLWAYLPLCLLSAILFLSLGRYPTAGDTEGSEPAAVSLAQYRMSPSAPPPA
ncbi:MFS transporter [Sphingomonas sp. BIUV-7]|uniref:MFS transporter n=1 Tax=Sphingomonas natans TaxID=3063330 RepID=A0ABT8Y9S2_9SPHN|nr:MFS transporter [Sphingomonas sp. BIUV-7]MDO6414583.1 MFS transporter [Sphingomonas sp. BIUV-7]